MVDETVPQAQDLVVAIEKVAHHLADVIETAPHRLEVETEKVAHLLVVTETVVRLHSVAVVTVLLRLVETEKVVVVHRTDAIGTVPHLLVVIEKVHHLTVMKCSVVNVQVLEVMLIILSFNFVKWIFKPKICSPFVLIRTDQGKT